jgi:hypothetical protein
MRGRTLRTPRVEERFLKQLAAGGSVTSAARAIETGRSTVYQWRDDDVNFAKAWDDAIESGTDVMEDEAVRRAVEGVDRPIYYKGKVVGAVKEYSDELLIRMLKARRKEKYSDRLEGVVSRTVRVVEVMSYADVEPG